MELVDLFSTIFFILIYPIGLTFDLYFWCSDKICKRFRLGIYRTWYELELMHLGRS